MSIFWLIMPKWYCIIQFNDCKMINDRGCAGVSDWRVRKFLLTHFPHHLSEVSWQITVKRLNQLLNSCFHQLQNYLIRLKFWPAFQGQNNLNNYFRLHVCLSIRPSVCPCVTLPNFITFEVQRPNQTAAERGEAKLCILNFKTTWSEFQQPSQTAFERGKAEPHILNFKTTCLEF